MAAGGVGADRQVADQADRHAGIAGAALRGAQAVVGQPLQEHVIADLVGTGAGEGRQRGVLRRAMRDGPAPPVAGHLQLGAGAGLRHVLGLQRLEGGVRQQRRAAIAAEFRQIVGGVGGQQLVAVFP